MSLPWFKFDTAAWIQDTRVLSPVAKGFWIDVLCFMWKKDDDQGSLSGPVPMLARITGTPESDVIASIEEFEIFNICDVSRDGHGTVTLVSRRMSRLCKERNDAAERQRNKRKRDKAAKDAENPADGHGDVTPDVTDRRKKEEGRRKKEEPPKPPVPGGRTSGPKDRDKWTKKQLSAEQVDAYPNFQRWWKAYPVKKGKRLAFEAWVKRGLEFEDIDVLVKKLAQHHKGVEPEFVPHGSTYLNQYRDEDDLQPDSKPKRSGGRYQIDGELGA